MKKRYSKKVREEAALICAIAASEPGAWYSVIEQHLGDGAWSDESHCLASYAYGEARRRMPNVEFGDVTLDAEAEALIRTGWSP